MKQAVFLPAQRLTSRQHWQVTLGLLVVYYPILLYLGFPTWDHTLPGFLHVLPFTMVSCAVILPLFYVWLRVAERIQDYLFGLFGEGSVLELAWPAQLLTFLVSVLLGVLLAVIHLNVLRWLDAQMAGLGWRTQICPRPNDPEMLMLWIRSLNVFFIMLMLSVFYLLANRRASGRVQEFYQKTQELETSQAQSQLAALKNQVNPHFLFNSLSILTSLVEKDAKLSVKFIGQLSRAYRYTLEQQDNHQVPLQTELTFIQAYTFLLKIRFNEKFAVEVRVPETVAAQCSIAPLTLQLLIENVVKHNQMSLEQPLHVCISVEDDELVVRNTLQRRPATSPSTQVGLRNIQHRYRLLTDRPVLVQETAQAFMVRIPLL